MSRLFQSVKIHLLLTALSALSLIILTVFFYLPHIHYAIIPYVWRGWFLPIEGIVLLLALAGVITIVGCYYAFSRKNQTKTIFKSLAEYWWIGVRIYLGFSWIVVGLTIWTPIFSRYDFPQMVDYMAADGPFPWYNSLLANVVSPNAQVFARLIQYAQLFIGLCLLLGLLTNLASIIGIFLNINFLIAISWADPTWTVAAQNIFVAFHEALFILLLVGRRFGVDEYLAKEFPRVFFW